MRSEAFRGLPPESVDGDVGRPLVTTPNRGYPSCRRAMAAVVASAETTIARAGCLEL